MSFTKWQEDLTQDIRYFNFKDDLDSNGNHEIDDLPKTDFARMRVKHPTHGYDITMTECNVASLKSQFERVKDSCKCILEIGVDCNYTPTEMTSTRTLLDNKKTETIYIGVDIDDKSYLNNPEKNIYTIKTDSSNYEGVVEFIKSKGVTEIDFFFIDGWHSIRKVMEEWEFTRLLSQNGIVGLHDTAYHPGPYKFLKYLNKDKWNVIENSCPSEYTDFGIGFAWRK
jgi:hypothetical protein